MIRNLSRITKCIGMVRLKTPLGYCLGEICGVFILAKNGERLNLEDGAP